MRILLFSLAFILFTGFSFAQTSDNFYDYTGKESEGLTRVEYKGRMGYINSSKKEVIDLKYLEAFDFEDGLAIVSIEKGKYGMINTSGKMVIPLKYEGFYAWFQDGLISAKLDNKWGKITKEGKTAIPHQFRYLGSFSEGLADAAHFGEGNLKYGYVNSKGKEVIPFIYDDVSEFSEGLAAVGKNGNYGFINSKGEGVIPFQYEETTPFSEGLAAVKIGGKYGYIDKNNRMVNPAIYTDAEAFINGEAVVSTQQDYFHINKKGVRLPKGRYLMVYTKGLNMGEQYWYKAAKLDKQALLAKYNEGFRLSNYVYDQQTNEIFVTMSNSTASFVQGGIGENFSKEQLWKKIQETFDEDKRNVSHVTFGKGKWSWHATNLRPQQSQSWMYLSNFPDNDVFAKIKKGFYITTLAYGDQKWIVILRDEKFAGQEIVQYKWNEFNQEEADKWLKKGFAITQLVFAKGVYTVIYTKGLPVKEQILVWTDEIPAREIKQYWDKGYSLYKTYYVSRWMERFASISHLLE